MQDWFIASPVTTVVRTTTSEYLYTQPFRGHKRGSDKLAIDAKCAGDRAHRDATAVQFYCLCGFLDCEAVLTSHDVVSGEVLRDRRAVHTILLS